MWEWRNGRCRHRLVGHTSTVRCLKMASEFLAVTGSRDSTLRVWDIVAGKCETVFRFVARQSSAVGLT